MQSVDRAVSVLEILAQRGEAGVSEVAADIGVHKSTAFRLLAALEERELVEQTQDRGKYRLGFGILRLASAVPGQLDVTQQARGVCEQLAGQLGETVNIAVRRSHFVVNIDQARGPSTVATHNWVGELTPLHATSSGKVLLAYMTPEERRNMLARRGLSDSPAIRSRRNGNSRRRSRPPHATDMRFRSRNSKRGSPPSLRLYMTTPAVSLRRSVSGPVYRFTEERMREVAPDVVAAAAAIGNRMGHLD